MIPKKIHYCWFGKGEKSPLVKHCIESWQKNKGDFEIIEWNESNFDVKQNIFIREAYEQKKWAFVSDFARAKILYDEGGFYLDTDMELKAPLSDFTVYRAICSFEARYVPFSAFWGVEAGHQLAKDIIDYYNGLVKLDLTPCPKIFSELLVSKYAIDDSKDTLQVGNHDVMVFPSEYFSLDLPKNYITHHFGGSWHDSWEESDSSYKSYINTYGTVRAFVEMRDGKKKMKSLIHDHKTYTTEDVLKQIPLRDIIKYVKNELLNKRRFVRFVKNILTLLSFREKRVILIMPPNIRFGNHLYYLMYCHTKNQETKKTRYFIREHPHLTEWLSIFPELKKLVIPKSQERVSDFKIKDYNFKQRFSTDFSMDSLEKFVSQYITPELDSFPDFQQDTLVINLRIGDYYNKNNKGKYGYNQSAYVQYILDNKSMPDFKKVIIISDDQGWCRENLSFLNDYFPAVEISDVYSNPAICFKALCRAPNLIISNSTFSYWGAYVSSCIHKNPLIIAPEFHSRETFKAYQLLPQWNLITGKEFNYNMPY